MENEPTMNDLLEGFGIDPDTVNQSDPAPEGGTDPAPADNPASDPEPAGTDPAAEGDPTDPKPDTGTEPAQNREPDKQQQAFIYLRQQNQTFKNTLKGVAEVLGIDPKALGNNDTDLLAALQAKVTENQSQKSGVPVEMLERLNTLETRNAQIEHAERERAALLGLQQVKDKYGLDEKSVTKFTQELIGAGLNPLEGNVDFIKEYRNMHFEELQQKAIEDAIAKEQARAAKAQTSASVPDGKRGDPGNSDGKITTQAQLNSWLDAQAKK